MEPVRAFVVSSRWNADPGAELIRVGEWCRDHGWQADRYGDGALIGASARVADQGASPIAY